MCFHENSAEFLPLFTEHLWLLLLYHLLYHRLYHAFFLQNPSVYNFFFMNHWHYSSALVLRFNVYLKILHLRSNNEHYWTPVKYLNVLEKYYQLPILGVLDMSGHFHQKQ